MVRVLLSNRFASPLLFHQSPQFIDSAFWYRPYLVELDRLVACESECYVTKRRSWTHKKAIQPELASDEIFQPVTGLEKNSGHTSRKRSCSFRGAFQSVGQRTGRTRERPRIFGKADRFRHTISIFVLLLVLWGHRIKDTPWHSKHDPSRIRP